MSEPAIDRPTPEQIAAADPRVSAWVGANAGSGKTRVLTQRVARLLLAGAEPERILCLTYTRAAAAEMQNRLFAMLGGWAMAPDDRLGAELAAIAGTTEPVADPGVLARARRLFARALETPGGLKIQTIHAFCDALLRRFPLEAGVSPRFQVLDERQQALMLAGIRAEMAAEAEAGRDPAFDLVSDRMTEDRVESLIDKVLADRAEFPETPIGPRLAAHFGAMAETDATKLATTALARLDWRQLGAYAGWLETGAGKSDARAAAAIRKAQILRDRAPAEAADCLAAAFLTGEGAPRSRRGFPVRAVTEAHPEADALTDALIGWAAAWRETRNAHEAAARARDLDAFATALLARYRAAREARALLDFDDLVARAAALLTRADMAAWVLWRLDRGIDHILVDEAQDTAPAQWQVIRAIAAEFHAGAGARAANRTLFVVGDEKQSIYSFQGAEPRAFGANRAHFESWLKGMGQALARPALHTSFRSAPGILAFVDAVFAGEAARGLTVEPEPVSHFASRTRDGSRIDLWPLIEAEPAADPQEWDEVPVDALAPGNAKLRLARILAGEIERMVREERLPARGGRRGRRVRPGDILVLVARRDVLATALIRELKARRLPVAGSDRLSIAEELAVQDLLALLRVATTPADDLSLAALLRSPLCGLSEDDLFALAWNRRGTLWQAVMAAGDRHPKTVAMLRDLADRADYLRPYEFLERALIRHDGRRRLLARLGHEAEDPIDELLQQALTYEASETPSLAGFVAWIEAADITVKREMEHGRDEVRVMTVHGAKGLEAPVVILPDTLSRGGSGGPVLLPAAQDGNRPALMLWAGAKQDDDAVTRRAREDAEALTADERKRLLYVALTRAEDWLILCAAGKPESVPGSWYEMVERGMEALGAGKVCGPGGLPGPVRRCCHDPVPVTGAPAEDSVGAAPPAPDRAGWLTPAPPEERPRRLSPSDLVPHVEAGGTGAGRKAAMERGEAVHLLLERLPAGPAADRPALAQRLIGHRFPALPGDVAEDVIAEALAVLEAPFAHEMFGPDSFAESGIAIDLPTLSAVPMNGRIDRLVLTPGRVLVVDFKSDARPPVTPDDVPAAYLAQLACYHAAAAALWPQRLAEAAILWTASRSLMHLPAPLLARALAARTIAPA